MERHDIGYLGKLHGSPVITGGICLDSVKQKNHQEELMEHSFHLLG